MRGCPHLGGLDLLVEWAAHNFTRGRGTININGRHLRRARLLCRNLGCNPATGRMDAGDMQKGIAAVAAMCDVQVKGGASLQAKQQSTLIEFRRSHKLASFTVVKPHQL
jgi:hypothetical protein